MTTIHAKTAVTADDPSVEVGSDEWNAGHSTSLSGGEVMLQQERFSVVSTQRLTVADVARIRLLEATDGLRGSYRRAAGRLRAEGVAFSETGAGSAGENLSGSGSISVVFSEAATGQKLAEPESRHFILPMRLRRVIRREGEGAETVKVRLAATGRRGAAGEGTARARLRVAGTGRRQGLGSGLIATENSVGGAGVAGRIGHGRLTLVYSASAEGVGDHVDEDRQRAEDELLLLIA